MWIASCTKLLTSIATMQHVQRGLFTLDEDIRPILQELNDLDTPKGIDEITDELKYKKNIAPIMLSYDRLTGHLLVVKHSDMCFF
ncbi:MAG: hypothetical protein M1818_005271 [Claussenomyces sp. TS43310]|nr:MAG: hypothetical protein M1818_005271 [Claussenomyces sp. TS43310]